MRGTPKHAQPQPRGGPWRRSHFTFGVYVWSREADWVKKEHFNPGTTAVEWLLHYSYLMSSDPSPSFRCKWVAWFSPSQWWSNMSAWFRTQTLDRFSFILEIIQIDSWASPWVNHAGSIDQWSNPEVFPKLEKRFQNHLWTLVTL